MDRVEIESFFDLVAKSGYESMKDETDTYDSEGFLICGKCKERKEMLLTSSIMAGRKVPITCKCRRDYIQKQELKFQKQENERIIKALKQASLMDKRLLDARFEKFEVTEENEKNLKFCKRYVEAFEKFEEKNQGLLFYGKVGTGKSYAAACIANALLDDGIGVVITSFVKILEVVRKGHDAEETLKARLNNARLVVFDDLGAERNTDYAVEQVYNIIDARYRASKPMILTTNLTLKEMMEETDIKYKRIYDRIFECCYPMEFKGKSFRLQKSVARFKSMEKMFD